MNIRSVGVELLHAKEQPDGQTDMNKAYSRFSQCEKRA
jgi:hypothetical protein